MPRQTLTELKNAEKRLNDAREKLDRIQSGQQIVRGKEKKIESLKTSIAILESKVTFLYLRNAASNPSTGLSAAESRASATQTITEQEPMQIEDEVTESLENLVPAASPHGHQSAHSNDVVMLDKAADVANASSSFATSEPPAHSGLETPTLQMDLPASLIVQVHDMGPNFTNTWAVDTVNSPRVNSVHDHDMGAIATDPQAFETVKKLRQESTQDHGTHVSTDPQAIGTVKNSGPHGVNIGIGATGSQVVEHTTKTGSLQDHVADTSGRTVDVLAFASQVVQPLHIPQVDSFQDHDKGINCTSGKLIFIDIDQGGSAAGVVTVAEHHSNANGVDCTIDSLPLVNDAKKSSFNARGSLQGELGSGNMCIDDDGCMGDWFWNGKYEVDEDVYSFQIQEHHPGTTSIVENMTQTCVDLESRLTSLRRQDWENQRGIMAHFEQQLKQLKSKQQALFRSLSFGFNGNLRRTKAHIAGIIQSCRDVETLESRIRDHSNHAKAKRWDYLASRNEDDQLVLIEAQKTLKGAQERLADIDPMDTWGIQTEQGIIRISKERIALLFKGIAIHSQEMNELAPVAKLQADGGEHVPDKFERSEAAENTNAKGKMKVYGVQKGSDLRFGVTCVAATTSQPLVSEKTSQRDQDALKSLDNFLQTKDSKQLSYTYRRKAREDVNFFPDVSFTSVEVTKLIFETDRLQTLCEYHRKGKHNFNPDTATVLHGQGFKGQSVDKASKVEPPHEDHLHCGCPIHEVAMEFFFWKTTRAFSSNPNLSGSYAMEQLWKFKPSTRSFWNKSFRDYTGLQTEDLVCPDYGTSEYAIRIALTQLHTQVERLKLLRAPIVVQVIFPDTERDVFNQHGIETGMKQAEEYWGELKSNHQVYPLPFIEPTRRRV